MIEWVDSATVNGWHCVDDYDCYSKCVTVGILHHEDANQVIIIQSKSDSGNCAEVIAIPWCCIKKIKKLTVK